MLGPSYMLCFVKSVKKMSNNGWKQDNESQIAGLKKTQSRKRKWKPASNETSRNVIEKHCSSPENSFVPGSKYTKVGKKEQSLFQARTSNNLKVSISNLPNELIGHIILYLNGNDLGRFSASCVRFNEIVNQSHIWRSLCRLHYPYWNNLPRSDGESPNSPLYGSSWKRQYILNHTKNVRYQLLGSGGSKRRPPSQVLDTTAAYGFKKLSCSRDHVFALDLASYLHVYRWEREPITNEYVYRRIEWHQDFARHVIDVTTDPRYDNSHRRYVYVLTQSEAMRERRGQPFTRSTSSANSGWDSDGNSIAGDKIDVFDERTCRRVFNMTFDPEMRFIAMKLTSMSPHQKTLYILTDTGKVYSLHLYESSLLNLGSEGMQVTLKSASKSLGERVTSIETSVGLVSFLSESGKLYVVVQRRSEFSDIFGRETAVKLAVPHPIHHVAKIVTCSIGDRHLGFIDEYNRAFVVGNNRYGQLGTGDRMDRSTPVQVLFNKAIKILHCSLNHSLAVVESRGQYVMLGTGCGNNGRLPGNTRGSVEFVMLDVKVPWGARQVDVHKECIFLLSCYDIDRQTIYKQQPSSELVSQYLSLKSLQELLMDVKKANSLVDKTRIIEAMIAKTSQKNNRKVSYAGKTPEQKIKNINSGKLEEQSNNVHLDDDLKMLHEAIEQLRLTAERIELDKQIASNQQAAA